MITEKKAEPGKLLVILKGRLDTETGPDLENELKDVTEDITELSFEMSELDYISSAGLRVLLSAHKKMDAAGGKMTIRNAGKALMEVFDITGFLDVFTFETVKRK